MILEGIPLKSSHQHLESDVQVSCQGLLFRYHVHTELEPEPKVWPTSWVLDASGVYGSDKTTQRRTPPSHTGKPVTSYLPNSTLVLPSSNMYPYDKGFEPGQPVGGKHHVLSPSSLL